jgi:hypothetical protein
MPEPIRRAAKFWAEHWSHDCWGFTIGGVVALAGIVLYFWYVGGL